MFVLSRSDIRSEITSLHSRIEVYDSSQDDSSRSQSELEHVDETSSDDQLEESGVGGSGGLEIVSSVEEDTTSSLQFGASSLCCLHLFSGLFNTDWINSRVSARSALTFFWRILLRCTRAIVRTTISKSPSLLARKTFQCSSTFSGTRPETLPALEMMFGAQESLELSGSQRGLSGGVKGSSSPAGDTFSSILLNSNLCCLAMAPLCTLCHRREWGLTGPLLVIGSSDRQTVGAISTRIIDFQNTLALSSKVDRKKRRLASSFDVSPISSPVNHFGPSGCQVDVGLRNHWILQCRKVKSRGKKIAFAVCESIP